MILPYGFGTPEKIALASAMSPWMTLTPLEESLIAVWDDTLRVTANILNIWGFSSRRALMRAPPWWPVAPMTMMFLRAMIVYFEDMKGFKTNN
jgi:hypothetical protein